MAQHIVLLGDSVFDNGAYVAGGPDVAQQLREILPSGYRASLCAVDGAVTSDVPRQMGRLPPEASHLILSVGGNDALQNIVVLEEKARSVGEALERLAAIGDAFQARYRNMLKAVLGEKLPTAICTIYDPRFPDPRMQKLATTALKIFNDVITREAYLRGLPLLDLRLICNEDRDYANPIEPSTSGGAKISRAILNLVREHDFGSHRAEAFI